MKTRKKNPREIKGMKNKEMKKIKKTYIVELEIIEPYDEIEVQAFNIKEAKKIAEKEMNPEYQITDIYYQNN